MSLYWIGVIVAFFCIFVHIGAEDSANFDVESHTWWLLFLLLSFLSWLVPIIYLAGMVIFGLYFIVYEIVHLF